MAYNFLSSDREQPYLMPPSVKDWLPEGDLAWFLLESLSHNPVRHHPPDRFASL